MSKIKGFRTWDEFDGFQEGDPYQWGNLLSWEERGAVKIYMHTGEHDREGTPIYEGDWLVSKTCTVPFEVIDIVSFLKQCGAYESEHGVRLCDSLTVYKEPKKNV